MTETIKNNGVVVRATLKPKAEEVFRGLWTSLFYSGYLTGKCVLVCSSDESEGTSTITSCLALSGTSSGPARVALVDFNLRKPSLHRILRAKQSPGVGEILIEGIPPESAAQRINASLDLYAAGAVEGKALDVLRNGGLSRFLDVLAEGYDHIIIDASAVNEFPDAQVLAGMVKDVVLVAHTERTPREAVAQAKKRLESGGGRVVGLVLNLRTYPIPKFLYQRM